MKLNISDHALLRYIERIGGVDIEALRRRVAETPGLQAAFDAGALSYSHDGFTYRIRNGYLTTIEPGKTPQAATRGGHKHKNGRSQRMNQFQKSKGRGRRPDAAEVAE